MNGKFLEKFIAYREVNRLAFTRLHISQKIRYQFSVVNRKDLVKELFLKIESAETINSVLLFEARAAKIYWNFFGELLNEKVTWNGRRPHSKDPVNQLLDIGYHFIVTKLTKICDDISLPTGLGIFHKAQSNRAKPLIYDFMEWLRPILVDRTLVMYIRKKKKFIEDINDKEISKFVYRLKLVLEKRLYNKKLGYCITLEYWIRLNLLEFMSTVNNNRKYEPRFPSLRHETRCKKPLQKIEAVWKSSIEP